VLSVLVVVVSLVVLSLLDVLLLVVDMSMREVAMMFLSWLSCSSNKTGMVSLWWFQFW
jgi:hypothetical protein